MARQRLSLEQSILRTLQSPKCSSSPRGNPPTSLPRTPAGPQSSEIPQYPRGSDWLKHPNLEAEFHRLKLGKTNVLTLRLSEDEMFILFGYTVLDSQPMAGLFFPMWGINNAAEGAALITEVMNVCGPILKDLKVDVNLQVNATISNQLVDGQEETGQQMRHQWYQDVARITRQAKTISIECSDKTIWDDFIRFLTSLNEAPDESDYPWPDLQILHLASSSPDLLRYAQKTLVSYLAENENRSGDDAPPLSRLNVPGSFYFTTDAEILHPGWLLKNHKPRAEDDDEISVAIWTRRQD
ncbi:hypothetical protein FRC00_006570 [Tulasnella sp. 408]|nr:hypothetical protein FRC00_006570 [Tulasnella sp. 408]